MQLPPDRGSVQQSGLGVGESASFQKVCLFVEDQGFGWRMQLPPDRGSVQQSGLGVGESEHFRRSVPLLRIRASGGGCSCRRTEGLSNSLGQGLASPGHVASQEVCLAVIQEVCLAVILREPLSVVPLSVRESCSRWGGIESGGKVGSWWGWEVRIPRLPWEGARLGSGDAGWGVSGDAE
jgi:hypothetical protein